MRHLSPPLPSNPNPSLSQIEYAYFFFYSLVRTSYLRRLASRRPAGSPAAKLSTIAELALGAVAGALAQIFTIPVSVIATRQQLGAPKGKGKKSLADGADDEEEEHDGSFFGVAREIVREEGFAGLWLGIKPGLVLTVNPAITYGMFERIKGAVLAARESVGDMNTSLGPGLSFALGATSKSLATVVRAFARLVRSLVFTYFIPCAYVGDIPVHNGQGSHPDA